MPKRRPDRVVLDTNVLVSAIISGRFSEIIALPVVEDIAIYTCDKQINELQTTLSKARIRKLLASAPRKYIALFKVAAIETIIDERFDRSPDPDDNFLFDLAYSVKSHCLVTNEKAILNLKQVNEIKIISITEFRKILREK